MGGFNRESMGGGAIDAVELYLRGEVLDTEMGGNISVPANGPSLWILDAGGTGRNVVMPAEEAAGMDGKVWFFVNIGGETLTIQNDAAGTIIALGTTESVLIGVFGGAWRILMQGASA